MKGDKAAYLTSGVNRNPLFKWEDYNNWCFKIENLLLILQPRGYAIRITTFPYKSRSITSLFEVEYPSINEKHHEEQSIYTISKAYDVTYTRRDGHRGYQQAQGSTWPFLWSDAQLNTHAHTRILPHRPRTIIYYPLFLIKEHRVINAR